jgi:aspartate/methionine/tyrosine aminotransferase
LLINDNPYSFVLNDNPMSLLQVNGAKEVALELNSLSKTNMAGWRVGMVLGNAKAIDAILKVKMDSGMFFGIQKEQLLNSDKSWFDSMNEFTKNAAF